MMRAAIVVALAVLLLSACNPPEPEAKPKPVATAQPDQAVVVQAELLNCQAALKEQSEFTNSLVDRIFDRVAARQAEGK